MRDERIRFNLAIECGNIEVALQSAQVGGIALAVLWFGLGLIEGAAIGACCL